jgi:hypothetical protein
MTAPILFRWTDDGTMVPMPRFMRRCQSEFKPGKLYPLVVEEGRSMASHNHYFATIDEAWKNLPEGAAEHFPTPDHLRKHALIKAGFCDKTVGVFSSHADAVRAAALVIPADSYAIVSVVGRTVTLYRAKSQRLVKMGKADFQASKQAVLEIVAGLLGVDSAVLSANAGKAA